jgi:hypothetical protein
VFLSALLRRDWRGNSGNKKSHLAKANWLDELKLPNLNLSFQFRQARQWRASDSGMRQQGG